MASATAQPALLHRGARLGLPESGSGSMAGPGRRTVALFLDWLAAMIISGALIPYPTSQARPLLTLGIFAVQVWLFTWLWGASFGQRIMRLRVRALRGRVSVVGAAVRTLLICVVIPPAIWDADGRGMHDRAAGTVVLNA
jgi:uncharacterized RDD family membrane protein YckC